MRSIGWSVTGPSRPASASGHAEPPERRRLDLAPVGDRLAAVLVVPVGFVNMAVAGTRRAAALWSNVLLGSDLLGP